MEQRLVPRSPNRAGARQAAVVVADPLTDALDSDLAGVVDRWLMACPGGRERLIPLLHRLQDHLGCIPETLQELVADRLGMAPVQVAGVVSFYDFFTPAPRGRYPIKICMGTACFVGGGMPLLATLEAALGISVGQVTGDRLFSLEQVRCIGACSLAPAIMVGDEVYGKLDHTAVRSLVARLRRSAAAGDGSR